MPQNPTPAAAGDTNPTTPMTPEQYNHIRAHLAGAARQFGGIDYVSPVFGLVRDAMAEVDRLRAELDKVAAFAAQRAEYVTSILNCHPDNKHDYYRWQGHAESRRQLSQSLGLPVAWPAETEPPSAPSQREAGAL
ncbi:hypothetical protein ACIQ1S_09780 [Streptomyces griseus]|uniref:hypothetical protein n=1 Tax=Streptomyces griseus TaxID=1911 RepID=UPI00382020A3